MKKKVIIGIVSLIFMLMAFGANACEIHFKVIQGEKEIYQINDEVVVSVIVIYTHRNCPEGIEATKFNFSGAKALGATKWKELGEGKYERKLKLQITEDKKGNHLLSAVRTCDKDGGTGNINFSVE